MHNPPKHKFHIEAGKVGQMDMSTQESELALGQGLCFPRLVYISITVNMYKMDRWMDG